jgi:hypothetical protein
MGIYKVAGFMPQIDEDAFVAESASVMGNVLLKKGGSIWFNATVRADLDKIVIGEHSNIQDNCVVHLDVNMPVIVGDYVTVGIAIFTILSYVLLIGTPIVYVIIPALFELEISPWAFFTDDSAYELNRAEFERICEERTETLLAKIFNN